MLSWYRRWCCDRNERLHIGDEYVKSHHWSAVFYIDTVQRAPRSRKWRKACDAHRIYLTGDISCQAGHDSMITEGIAVYGNNRYRMQTTSQHESSIEPDRILATRCTARTSHRNSTAKKKRAQELIKSMESYHSELLRSVRVLLQGRRAGMQIISKYIK